MDDIAILESMLTMFSEGSPRRAVLIRAIADVRRLDKVERMQADVEYQLGGAWTVAAYNKFSAGTLREAIDGVLELEQICG